MVGPQHGAGTARNTKVVGTDESVVAKDLIKRYKSFFGILFVKSIEAQAFRPGSIHTQ